MTADDYRNFLLSIPSAKKASGGRMVTLRCFECGDSKDITHTHMYISIPQEDDEPSLFYCHKCKCGGVMDQNILMKWGLFNVAVAGFLSEHNKKARTSSKNKKYIDREVYRLFNNIISQTRESELKLKYINNRLGTNLNYMDCLNKKIVLNLNDLLQCNHITELTRNVNIVNQFNDYFLGFISVDNAFVNMRKLVGDGIVYKGIDKRYCRYNIFNKYNNTEKFYTMPCNIDVQTPYRTKLNIAEGEFDILSVYYNLRQDDNQIYASIGGSNYIGILSYFIRTLKLPYLELHFYPDNDKYGSNEVIANIARFVAPFNMPMYVHRNLMLGQKDFGVSPDMIKESIEPVR